jgi:hypothetical protein
MRHRARQDVAPREPMDRERKKGRSNLAPPFSIFDR